MAAAPTSVLARTSAFSLLSQARSVLLEAVATDDAGERFRLAHLSALRTAAAVAADRGRPASARRRLMNVWVLLERVAPELSDWAALFAAGAQVRAAVEAGAVSAVTTRAADDQVRAATEFLALVESGLGLLAA
ncbi:SAV_6107 family HEPN domain-containing protein [Jatrophihabitans fulvus]